MTSKLAAHAKEAMHDDQRRDKVPRGPSARSRLDAASTVVVADVHRADSRAFRAFGMILACTLAGCGGDDKPAATPLSPAAIVGAKAFADPTLSASGRISCASCHAPQAGHSAANALAVQVGGAALDTAGMRNTQTLRYLQQDKAFFFDVDGTPTGGFFWDGRANSQAEQAASPLLGVREMANADKAAVVDRLTRTSWAEEFKAVYGSGVFDDVEVAFASLAAALQQYQREDAEFNAYTSKYDAYLAGKARLTPQEASGLALFEDPAKGNCAACHPSSPGPGDRPPLFTDFTYDNLGVPRNPEIPANADPNYFDLGLCGRADLAGRADLCGAFKVPTLRNVALRGAFFHNGRFKTLRDVVTFYVQRDTNPEKWYPRASNGSVEKFDDLPAQYRANVNVTEGPYNRGPGAAPALSTAEIEDVLAFLGTLTDGWWSR